jgi:two-component system response regulator YesN
MYRILVVDDEKYIADSIAYLIATSDEENIEVYKTYLPSEALDIANNTKIDILITDIDMPNMNGFMLSEKINELWKHCKTIILSAFNDSDYIQKALRNNIVDYVIKSESDDVILSSLKKAVYLLENELEQKFTLEQAHNYNELIDIYKKEKAFIHIITRPIALEERINICESYSLNINPQKSMILMIAKAKLFNEESYFTFISNLLEIELFIKNFLKKSINIECGIYDNKFLFLLQSQNEYQNIMATIGYLRDSFPLIQQKICEKFGCNISFVMTKDAFKLNEIYDCFVKLNSLIQNNLAISNDFVIEIGMDEGFGVLDQRNIFGNDLLDYDFGILSLFLDNDRYKEFLGYLFKVVKRLHKTESYYNSFKSISYSLAELLLKHSKNKMYYNNDEIMRLINTIENVFSAKDTKELERVVAEHINILEEKTEKLSIGVYDNIKNIIFEYVDITPFRDISLTNIANMVNFNPSYLSRIFRRISGKTFSNYVSKVKIDKAKELLENKNTKIVDIANILGFESSAYFTKYFKRITGKTPAEYRKNLISNTFNNRKTEN